MVERYSNFQAWAHNTFIAERALRLHQYIIEYGQLTKILAEKKERNLLDVGCGGGQAAIRMKEQYPHLNLNGIDLSEWMIASARQRACSKGQEIHFEVADVLALPFPNASFDVVYSFGSAKHWPDPLRGFSECWRVLKSEGELLVADATSDATPQEVGNFFVIAGFPSLLKKPAVGILSRRMFRPARSVASYRKIAAELQMPKGTVTHLPSMPAFLFRTRKP